MSKVKSYILDEIDENEFSLIAIHSSCEAYFMAFLLNLKCNCKFIRSIKRKGVAQKDFPFEDYEWIDLVNGIEISLFSNRILIFRGPHSTKLRILILQGRAFHIAKNISLARRQLYFGSRRFLSSMGDTSVLAERHMCPG